jgi:hypothetical protein
MSRSARRKEIPQAWLDSGLMLLWPGWWAMGTGEPSSGVDAPDVDREKGGE